MTQIDDKTTDEGIGGPNRSSEPVISFHDAEILNGENPVIYDLDMSVYNGDFVYIVGKVGTGKTSISRFLNTEEMLESFSRTSSCLWTGQWRTI